MKRYVILVCAVIMQMCLGATYSWSVYVEPLKEITGLWQGTVQFPFSLFYFAFPATMVLTGTLLSRLGPRRAAVTGGVIFGGGWLLAALGGVNFAFTVLGIGLCAGIGVGLAYIVPIAVCIQWFPRHKGLITGIAVAGFGGGAALVSQLGGWLMNARGATPFETFGIFGAAFMILVAGAGWFMRYAPNVEREGIARLKLSGVIGRQEFLILYSAMFTGLAAGFAVNANLKEFYTGQNLNASIAAVSLFAIANAVGRIIWGGVFDRVQATMAIRANLLAQAVVVMSALWLVNSTGGFLFFAFMTGFNYGGVLVLYASAAAGIWGNEHVGQVYGFLFSANIPAALVPIIAGFVYDISGNFSSVLIVLATLMIFATFGVWRYAAVLDKG